MSKRRGSQQRTFIAVLASAVAAQNNNAAVVNQSIGILGENHKNHQKGISHGSNNY